jgi:hypothetical protein
MSTQSVTHGQVSYQQVVEVLKALPADKLPSAYDYLRFLQQQAELDKWPFEATPAEMAADDAEWDIVLGTDASQRLMERAAAEIREEAAAGQTLPLEDLLNEDESEDPAGPHEVTH